ncbi:ABC transporter permease [Chryseolinea sp. T2]|uniref:ABC transporter permease n=1 Tax=Chryseolinea sp. T2 TaxID=3129255 RepID=UPI0030769463
MYKSYLTIAWRNLLRNQGYSAINIGGLAVAMTISMLIGMWVWNELSYDRNHEHYARLVQVMQQQTVDGKVITGYALPRPLEGAMRQDYGSDFSAISMSTWTDQHILTWNQQSISQSGNFVQTDFPEMISLKMISGTRRALDDPKSILLSLSAAKALFGNVDPVNQSVRIDGKWDVKVTGVYEDIPANSSFNELLFLSSWELQVMTEEWMKRASDRWDNNSFQMFALLAPGADLTRVSEKVAPVRAVHSKDNTFKPKVILHPMSEWHLWSNWENGVKTGGEIEFVWMFFVIGVAVLLLACINFINLATARSAKRSKEVGIRMTIGSLRVQLIQQFLSESILVVLLAFVLAVGAAQITLPWFNSLADKRIEIPWDSSVFWLVSLGFVLLTSLLSGFYPAFFLSSFRPVQALKSSLKTGRHGSLPRQVLVVFQFTVSIILLFSSLIIYDQIQYSKNRPIGYERDGLLAMPVMSPDFIGKFEAFNEEIKRTGAVIEASESSSPLTEIYNNSNSFTWAGKDPELQSSDFGVIAVTEDYGATIGWEIKEGRDFSLEFATDSMALILNEAAVDFMGVKNPIGMEITRGKEKFHVIGIVKDLIIESPYREVRPNIYGMDAKAESANWINLKLNPARSATESLAAIESVLKKYAPSVPFVYQFSNIEYGKKFSTEERVGKLAYVFTILAVFISCLGLVGLASFMAEQHTKEIGIRKVLGATVVQLWGRLSSGFVMLVSISCLAAVPLGYYMMTQWLSKYPYHVDISWETIAASVVAALGVALVTVSYQSIKAAMMNPVKSLKSE